MNTRGCSIDTLTDYEMWYVYCVISLYKPCQRLLITLYVKMSHTLSFLSDVVNSESVPAAAPPELGSNPDFMVILAALCCALLCAIGLIFLARCSCLRQLLGSATSAPRQPPPPPPALKRSTLKLLPTVRYSSQLVDHTDCTICLTEFFEDDLVRVLPLCGHVFHLKCIDRWLGCRSSCPFCRQVVVKTPLYQLCVGSQSRPVSCSAAMNDRVLGLA